MATAEMETSESLKSSGSPALRLRLGRLPISGAGNPETSLLFCRQYHHAFSTESAKPTSQFLPDGAREMVEDAPFIALPLAFLSRSSVMPLLPFSQEAPLYSLEGMTKGPRLLSNSLNCCSFAWSSSFSYSPNPLSSLSSSTAVSSSSPSHSRKAAPLLPPHPPSARRGGGAGRGSGCMAAQSTSPW